MMVRGHTFGRIDSLVEILGRHGEQLELAGDEDDVRHLERLVAGKEAVPWCHINSGAALVRNSAS